MHLPTMLVLREHFKAKNFSFINVKLKDQTCGAAPCAILQVGGRVFRALSDELFGEHALSDNKMLAHRRPMLVRDHAWHEL